MINLYQSTKILINKFMLTSQKWHVEIVRKCNNFNYVKLQPLTLSLWTIMSSFTKKRNDNINHVTYDYIKY